MSEELTEIPNNDLGNGCLSGMMLLGLILTFTGAGAIIGLPMFIAAYRERNRIEKEAARIREENNAKTR